MRYLLLVALLLPAIESQADNSEHMKALQKAAQELNAQTPIDIGDGTILVSVLALQNVFTYQYRLTDYATNKDPGTHSLQKLSDEAMLDYACKHKPTNQMLQSGAILVYNYSAMDGSHLASSRMTREIITKKCI